MKQKYEIATSIYNLDEIFDGSTSFHWMQLDIDRIIMVGDVETIDRTEFKDYGPGQGVVPVTTCVYYRRVFVEGIDCCIILCSKTKENLDIPGWGIEL